MAQALLLNSISRLSVRLSTVPSRYKPSWKAAVNGVEPSAALRVKSLTEEGKESATCALFEDIDTDMNLAVNKPAYKTSRLSRCKALAHVKAEPAKRVDVSCYY